MTNYFKIGKLVASHGLKGEMVLAHSLGQKSSLKGLEIIFIEENKDAFLPYFIREAKIKNENDTYISFEGIDTKEATRILLKREVWLNEKDFKKFAAGAAPISLLGFMIIDKGKEIGEVVEVIEQPHQILCKIMLGDKEALIPVHEGSLEKMDTKNRKLFLEIPDGLLELYRNA
ncbi:MAG: ribosome maturation factor RimM [Ginsengibacter sp.]